MTAHDRPLLATSWLMALALLMGAGATDLSAQSAPPQQQPAPDAALPALPDGFIVTPARPIVPLPRFEFQHRAPDSAESPSDPNSQPLGGGCRYEERKLELLV